MKKANKKINKLLKITLLLCMIFSQLASPIKTLAAEIVPSYEIEIVLDTDNNKFVVTSIGTKELVEDENYILEITRSFEYYDGSLNESENITTYNLVLGSNLNTGYDITRETFLYNGTSYIDVNVYDVTDDTIDFSAYTDEDYQTLLSTEEEAKVEKIMSTSFEEDVTDNETSITFEVLGEEGYVECDMTEGFKCNITRNDINNVVMVNYTTKNGNLNPNKVYHTVLKVNGVVTDLVTEDLSVDTGIVELDFSKMLPGVYNLEYSIQDDEDKEIFGDSLELTHIVNIPEGEEEIDNVEFIKEKVANEEVDEELFYSYTVLTEEEKDALGNDYRFLDNPLAFVFDSITSLSENDIVTDYNLFDEDTRYHVVYSSKFMGAFNDESDSYKVIDVKNNLNFDLPFTKVEVVDANGNLVSDNAFIQNGMKLVVTIFGEKLEYDFLVYGDVDGEYVELNDLNTLVNKVLNNEISYYDTYNLDFNKDGYVNIEDISVLGFNIYNKNFEQYSFDTTDVITPSIESDKEELFIDESFEVYLSLNGFEMDYINSIEGFVEYDSTALRLDKIECLNDIFVGNYLNNRFIYASDETFSSDEVLVKLSFTGLTEGTHSILVNKMVLLADGNKLVVNDSNELEIKVNRVLHTDSSLKSLTSSVGFFDKAFNPEVLEYNLYVDSSVSYVTLSGEVNDEFATADGFRTYTLYGGTTPISIKVTAEDETTTTYRVNVVKIYKSSNNNLKDLMIEGYDISFNKNTLEYKITVPSDVTSLDITALVEGYGAWAKIEGNENFQEGENIVTITVYAEDGSAKTYKLIVNKEAEKAAVVDEDDEEKTSDVNTEKVVIIILIILVVIGLLYLIFKKDDDDGDIKIEQIKPRKEDTPKQNEVKENKQNNHHKKNKNKK